MREYFSELNTDTRCQFLDEVQSITRGYGVFKVEFRYGFDPLGNRDDDICFWFERKTQQPLTRSIPLIKLYNYLENLGIEFSESNIDLWLSIARDYCFEEVKELKEFNK